MLEGVIGYCNEDGMMIEGTKPTCHSGMSSIYGPAMILQIEDDEVVSMSDEMVKKVYALFEKNNTSNKVLIAGPDVNLLSFNDVVDLTRKEVK